MAKNDPCAASVAQFDHGAVSMTALDVKIIYVQQDAAANAETNKRCVV